MWTDVRPFTDRKVTAGSKTVGLPTSAEDLDRLVASADVARLAAALVRVSLDRAAADDVRKAARSRR